MKKLFVTILLLLVAASFYTMYTGRDRSSDVPVITWRTDANPQREEQIMLFREWLVEKGHVQKDKNGKVVNYTEEEAAALNKAYGTAGNPLKPGDPHYVKPGTPKPNGDVQLETANNQSTLIQAVSGMAGDVFDTADVLGYSQLGVAMDITEDAKKNGYGLDSTYPGMAGLLNGMDGRQYAYPCNGSSVAMWINLSTLEKHGFSRPPVEWTPEEFEKMAIEYVKKANEGLPRQEYFYLQALDSGWGVSMASCIARSKGWDIYNETLTRSIANNDALKQAIATFHKWTYVDRIAPTAADVASMNTDAGYGGADYSNFISGKYAMIVMGRYCLIRFREVQQDRDMKIQFAVSQLPMYGYKNHPLGVRAAMPYRGSKQPELVKLFLEFLASKPYNQYIVEFADGLPPNPESVSAEMKAIGTERPNERDSSELEFTWARTIGLPGSYSPYVKTGSTNWLQNGINRFFNDRSTLDETLKYIETRYNNEIEISKQANPAMMERWKEDWALQQKIDAYKKEGKKIPVEWIKNPFYVKYYRDRGMLDESNAGGVR
ncbi:MAG: carbohydrate ABC transporter substrate-binding protein [Lentisphaeria bacterium]|nr:carbohydrate ABC transporter substrate-binding protein [Lentisphaeria bacterium]